MFKTNVIYPLCADVCKHSFNIQWVLFEAYIFSLGIVLNDKIPGKSQRGSIHQGKIENYVNKWLCNTIMFLVEFFTQMSLALILSQRIVSKLSFKKYDLQLLISTSIHCLHWTRRNLMMSNYFQCR